MCLLLQNNVTHTVTLTYTPIANFGAKKKSKSTEGGLNNNTVTPEGVDNTVNSAQSLDNADNDFLSDNIQGHSLDNYSPDSSRGFPQTNKLDESLKAYKSYRVNSTSKGEKVEEDPEVYKQPKVNRPAEDFEGHTHFWEEGYPALEKVEENPDVYRRHNITPRVSNKKIEEAPQNHLSDREISDILGRPANWYDSKEDEDANLYDLNIKDELPRSYNIDEIEDGDGYYIDTWGVEDLENIPKDIVYNWSVEDELKQTPNLYHGVDTEDLVFYDNDYSWPEEGGRATPKDFKPHRRGEGNDVAEAADEPEDSYTEPSELSVQDPEPSVHDTEHETSYNDSNSYNNEYAEFAEWRYPRSNADKYIRKWDTIEENVDQKKLPTLRGYRPDNDGDEVLWDWFQRITRYVGNNITGDRSAYNEFWNVINYVDPAHLNFCPPLAIAIAIIVTICRTYGGNKLILIRHPGRFVLGLYSHRTRGQIIYRPLLSVENNVRNFEGIEASVKATLKFVNGGQTPIYDAGLHDENSITYKYKDYEGFSQTQPTECIIKLKNLPKLSRPTTLNKTKPIKRIRPTLRRLASARNNSLRRRTRLWIRERANSVYYIYRNRLKNKAVVKRLSRVVRFNQSKFFS